MSRRRARRFLGTVEHDVRTFGTGSAGSLDKSAEAKRDEKKRGPKQPLGFAPPKKGRS